MTAAASGVFHLETGVNMYVCRYLFIIYGLVYAVFFFFSR